MMFQIENRLNCGQCKHKCPCELGTPTLLKWNLADYEELLTQYNQNKRIKTI